MFTPKRASQVRKQRKQVIINHVKLVAICTVIYGLGVLFTV